MLSFFFPSTKAKHPKSRSPAKVYYQGHNLRVTIYNRLNVLVTSVLAGISYGRFYINIMFQGTEEIPNGCTLGVREWGRNAAKSAERSFSYCYSLVHISGFILFNFGIDD